MTFVFLVQCRVVTNSVEHESLRALAEVEREHILRMLEACGGSQLQAARVLGIGRNTLWRKIASIHRRPVTCDERG